MPYSSYSVVSVDIQQGYYSSGDSTTSTPFPPLNISFPSSEPYQSNTFTQSSSYTLNTAQTSETFSASISGYALTFSTSTQGSTTNYTFTAYFAPSASPSSTFSLEQSPLFSVGTATTSNGSATSIMMDICFFLNFQNGISKVNSIAFADPVQIQISFFNQSVPGEFTATSLLMWDGDYVFIHIVPQTSNPAQIILVKPPPEPTIEYIYCMATIAENTTVLQQVQPSSSSQTSSTVWPYSINQQTTLILTYTVTISNVEKVAFVTSSTITTYNGFTYAAYTPTSIPQICNFFQSVPFTSTSGQPPENLCTDFTIDQICSSAPTCQPCFYLNDNNSLIVIPFNEYSLPLVVSEVYTSGTCRDKDDKVLWEYVIVTVSPTSSSYEVYGFIPPSS